jgi:hypothetical protein
LLRLLLQRFSRHPRVHELVGVDVGTVVHNEKKIFLTGDDAGPEAAPRRTDGIRRRRN